MSRPLLAVALLLALTLALPFAGCGSTKSTAPYGGGGGGAPGGPSFNLLFGARGTSNSVTFTDVGTWAYHCTTHQALGMTGTVIVSAAGADSDTVAVGVNGSGINSNVFTPTTVTIKPGGSVRWVNRSTMTNHTVTRP